MQRESDNDTGRFLCNLRKEDFKQAMNGGGEKERDSEISQSNTGIFSRCVCVRKCVCACIQIHLPIVLLPCMKIQASHKHRHTSEKIHLNYTIEM